MRARSDGRAKFGFWVGVLAGGVACVFLGLLVRLVWPEAEGERAVQKVWGPFLERGSSVTLLLASSPNLWVREFGKDPLPVGDPPFTLPAPDDPRFLDWYRRTVLRDPVRLGLHPNSHAVMGGEASAAVTVAGFLAARGVQLEQFQAESPSAAEIKDRNAIVLGRAEYSGVAAALQPSNGYTRNPPTTANQLRMKDPIDANDKGKTYRVSLKLAPSTWASTRTGARRRWSI
ncbi:MAG: hypothetical protein NTV52_04040 [Acidobacteria bacterium]|nr:hypothetical protein [Acidobacteriota bacterium]